MDAGSIAETKKATNNAGRDSSEQDSRSRSAQFLNNFVDMHVVVLHQVPTVEIFLEQFIDRVADFPCVHDEHCGQRLILRCATCARAQREST